jgi:hypothetical protein
VTVDTHPIGNLVAEVMDEIEGTYGADAELGVFAIIAEINIDDETGPGVTHVIYRCNDNRTWIQMGLFEAAKRATVEATTLEDDEE